MAAGAQPGPGAIAIATMTTGVAAGVVMAVQAAPGERRITAALGLFAWCTSISYSERFLVRTTAIFFHVLLFSDISKQSEILFVLSFLFDVSGNLHVRVS